MASTMHSKQLSSETSWLDWTIFWPCMWVQPYYKRWLWKITTPLTSNSFYSMKEFHDWLMVLQPTIFHTRSPLSSEDLLQQKQPIFISQCAISVFPILLLNFNKVIKLYPIFAMLVFIKIFPKGSQSAHVVSSQNSTMATRAQLLPGVKTTVPNT